MDTMVYNLHPIGPDEPRNLNSEEVKEFEKMFEVGVNVPGDESQTFAILGVRGSDDDPYSTGMMAVYGAIRYAIRHKDSMSEGEYNNLKAIEEFVRSRDNS